MEYQEDTRNVKLFLGLFLSRIAFHSWQEDEELDETFLWQVQGGHPRFWDILLGEPLMDQRRHLKKLQKYLHSVCSQKENRNSPESHEKC